MDKSNKADWLYCQRCEVVIEAKGGYVENEHHSCWNHMNWTDKSPTLKRLTAERTRGEIEECRDEISELNARVRKLLKYEKELRDGSATQQK